MNTKKSVENQIKQAIESACEISLTTFKKSEVNLQESKSWFCGNIIFTSVDNEYFEMILPRMNKDVDLYLYKSEMVIRILQFLTARIYTETGMRV